MLSTIIKQNQQDYVVLEELTALLDKTLSSLQTLTNVVMSKVPDKPDKVFTKSLVVLENLTRPHTVSPESSIDYNFAMEGFGERLVGIINKDKILDNAKKVMEALKNRIMTFIRDTKAILRHLLGKLKFLWNKIFDVNKKILKRATEWKKEIESNLNNGEEPDIEYYENKRLSEAFSACVKVDFEGVYDLMGLQNEVGYNLAVVGEAYANDFMRVVSGFNDMFKVMRSSPENYSENSSTQYYSQDDIKHDTAKGMSDPIDGEKPTRTDKVTESRWEDRRQAYHRHDEMKKGLEQDMHVFIAMLAAKLKTISKSIPTSHHIKKEATTFHMGELKIPLDKGTDLIYLGPFIHSKGLEIDININTDYVITAPMRFNFQKSRSDQIKVLSKQEMLKLLEGIIQLTETNEKIYSIIRKSNIENKVILFEQKVIHEFSPRHYLEMATQPNHNFFELRILSVSLIILRIFRSLNNLLIKTGIFTPNFNIEACNEAFYYIETSLKHYKESRKDVEIDNTEIIPSSRALTVYGG